MKRKDDRMNKSIVIKDVQCADAEALLAYLQIVGGESHNLTFGKEGLPVSVETEVEQIKSYQTHPLKHMWCAMDQGEMVGLCSFDVPLCKRMAHRGSFGISVRKDHWHQGIATAMMEVMFQHVLQNRNITIIAIEVIADNEHAISLYEKFNFQICGYWHKFFQIDGIGYDAVAMECDIEKNYGKERKP